MISPPFLVLLAVGAGLIGICLILGARIRERPGRMAIAAATFHPIAALSLFYSLAIHMHRSHGGWPLRLGDEGFPLGLVMHSDLAQLTFGSLLLACMFIVPIAILLCACVPRMRPGRGYLGIYTLTSGAALGAMMLAPDPFLSWWWD